jgi:hypothetical protein
VDGEKRFRSNRVSAFTIKDGSSAFIALGSAALIAFSLSGVAPALAGKAISAARPMRARRGMTGQRLSTPSGSAEIRRRRGEKSERPA